MFDADVIICGGSLGGVAAALAACGMGKKVVLLEATQWVGGQLTSQAVPPDEHRQIEFQGCTASYRSYRQTVRDYYTSLEGFSAEVKAQKSFCPADSEVSLLSHPPKLALKILSERLQPFVQKGLLAVYTQAKLLSAQVAGDEIASVTYEIAGQRRQFSGRVFLDATDTGELLEKSGTEFIVGAESASATGERDAAAVQDCADLQPCTYTACIENRKRGDFVIPKPYMYDSFKKLQMPYDCYPVYSMYGPDSQTGRAKRFGMFEGERDEKGNELFPLFKYRRIVAAKNFVDGSHPYDVTLVNWPQNDYFLGNLFGCADAKENDEMAKLFTLGFVYWLQTEAPRADGGKGYGYFRLATEYLGTDNGLSMAPYVRESRRIRALYTVTEQDVLEGKSFYDSVGVGSYPIDVHITTRSHTFFNVPTRPFTIPIGAMVPVRMKNLLPACKNAGTTHLTNGCFRLHPVEWNVGEVAGLLACFMLDEGVLAAEIRQNAKLFERFARLLQDKGIQRYWH